MTSILSCFWLGFYKIPLEECMFVGISLCTAHILTSIHKDLEGVVSLCFTLLKNLFFFVCCHFITIMPVFFTKWAICNLILTSKLLIRHAIEKSLNTIILQSSQSNKKAKQNGIVGTAITQTDKNSSSWGTCWISAYRLT